jgi:hypothetical protein
MTGWWVTSSSPTVSTTQSSGLELCSPLSHYPPGIGGFSYLCESLDLVSACNRGHFRLCLCRLKFRSRL